MRKRVVVVRGVIAFAMAAVLGVPALAAAQQQQRQPTREELEEAARQASFRSEQEAAKAWEAELARRKAEAVKRVYNPNQPAAASPKRTPWGHPDLRGYYITATYTPLQRPPNVTKPLYTAEEAIVAFQTQADTDATADPAVIHYDWKEFGMEAWQSPVRPNLRTALIVDPADGRLPPLTPEAQKRRAEAAALRNTRDDQTGIQIFGNLYTRCVLGGPGAAPLVRGGNPGSTEATSAGVSTEIQIFQTPDHVVIVHQSNTDVRIIPLDGRPHIPGTVRQWYGDSRGRWEGNTLVVEATNFNDRAPATNFQGSTDGFQIVERFTVLDDNTLRYEYTVTDPNTWTRPWSVEAPLPRIPPPLYEFACHEMNYGVINVVMGAQIRATEGVLDPRDPRAPRGPAALGREGTNPN
jgi:hypothetical protein